MPAAGDSTTQRQADPRTETPSAEATRSSSGLPPSYERTFPHRDSSVGEARKFAVEALSAWGVWDRLEDVCLCLSEVAANALVHASPPRFGFRARLTFSGPVVRLEVHDQGAGRPHRKHPSLDDTSGRGLLLVDELSDEWGVDDQPGNGKTVWLTFKITAPGPRTPKRQL
ncbi:ATP-binding protein [Streptomyces sioyaensis]|uniref:ATP-binding protein n=1 Tax=Streptomyces sioyaensis TaxID=67364 RepID=UPI0037A312F7